MSTPKQKNKSRYVVTSNLGKLLARRNLTQKQLAQMTGISERAISHIKNRKVVSRIDCDTAIRICLALSMKKDIRARNRKKIGLEALFPILSL